MSRRLESYFKDYDAYHGTRGNEICHCIGIPLIVISLLGLLSRIVWVSSLSVGNPLFQLDAGVIFWVVATFWYVVLDWRLGVPFSFVTLGGYFIGRAIPIPALWMMFVLGWVFQGIGHAIYEKKSPAFLKNVTHILVGPLWIFARVCGIKATRFKV